MFAGTGLIELIILIARQHETITSEGETEYFFPILHPRRVYVQFCTEFK